MRTHITPFRPASPQTADPFLSLIPTAVATTTVTTSVASAPTAAAATPIATSTATGKSGRKSTSPTKKSPSSGHHHHYFPHFHFPFFHLHSHSHTTTAAAAATEKESAKEKRAKIKKLGGMDSSSARTAAPPILTTEQIAAAKADGAKIFKTVRTDWAEEIERILERERKAEAKRKRKESPAEDEATTAVVESGDEADVENDEEIEVDSDDERIIEWLDLESDSDQEPLEKFKSPFRFSSPDEIPASRRKRRRLIEQAKHEEEEWNPGLKDWNRRRELWTGAKRDEKDGWIKAPRCRSRFADNQLTAQIVPQNYPRIYRNLVTNPSSTGSATVPINLSHVVSAIVEGWKADDQWPPKIGPIEPHVARRRERKKSKDAGSPTATQASTGRGSPLGLVKTRSREDGGGRRLSDGVMEGVVNGFKKVFGSPGK